METRKHSLMTGLWILFSISLLFILGIVSFFFTHNQAVNFSTYNYAIAQLLLLSVFFSIDKDKRNIFLLSPSFVAVSYVNVNFLFGSIAFKEEVVFSHLLSIYYQWDNYEVVMAYYNLANVFIIISFFFSSRLKIPFKFKQICDLRKRPKIILKCLALLLIIIPTYIELDLSLLGGAGSFSNIPMAVGAIILIVCIFQENKLSKRILYYTLIIVFFCMVSWEDKKDAIFLLLPIFLLEFIKFKLNIKLKQIFILCFIVLLGLYLVIIMSIMRGYGEYKVKSNLEASSHVLDYIKSGYFLPSVMNNLEISYVYAHSNNAIVTASKNPDRLVYGETFLKPFFIFVPREYFAVKPHDIIHYYTASVSEKYRETGGSWPVCFQAEMFWNFHFFGVFSGLLFFVVLNSLYLTIIPLIKEGNIINYIPSLYYYQCLLVLFRGCGLSMFLVFIFLTFLIFISVKFIMKLLYP